MASRTEQESAGRHDPALAVLGPENELRYGFFYGPNSWYDPNGGAADEVRKQQCPVIEGGEAKW
jgi:hypothetical protein